MRLLFGTSVIDAPAGCQATFAHSAVGADGQFPRVHDPSSDSDRLPETVWTEGMRIFLSPRPLQLAGVALTSTGELQAVFARARLGRLMQVSVNQATFSATDTHMSVTTVPAVLAPDGGQGDDVAASADAVAFPIRHVRIREA